MAQEPFSMRLSRVEARRAILAGRPAICVYCAQAVVRFQRGTAPGDNLRTADHVVPQAWGGSDAPENVRVACARCNRRRAIAGHCIAALRCAEAVLDAAVSERQLARWMASGALPAPVEPIAPPVRRKPRPPPAGQYWTWRSTSSRLVPINPLAELIVFPGQPRMLVEGTAAFDKLVIRPARDNRKKQHRWKHRVIVQARALGYDLVWFQHGGAVLLGDRASKLANGQSGVIEEQ